MPDVKKARGRKMVKKGLVECSECAKEFKDGDIIYECTHCNEILCDECWDDHICIDDEYDSATVQCEQCSGDTDADDARVCNMCQDTLCDSCWDDHCKNHLEEDREEWDYEDYVDEKVKEAI
jgi:hypothetical protein